jgi:putative copper export protein
MDHAMMAPDVGSMVVTAADLLALATCLGVLGFRIWVVSFKDEMSQHSAALLLPLWRLLGICLAVLALSSLGELLRRAMEMSAQPLAGIAPMLPAVLFKTHFGRVWLLRPVALLVLWLGWRSRPRLGSPGVSATMLAAACLIAASRSLSGHAADWGDITLHELMDWSHLLAVSFWGGSLIGLTLAGFGAFTAGAAERRQLVVAMARRWSALAGAMLAVVVSTGIYNAWLELQRIAAFWETAYGRVLLIKLSLALIIVALGAMNRYLGIPSLRAWASGSPPGDIRPFGLPAIVLSWLTQEQTRRRKLDPLLRFVRRARLEGALMIATLLCAAVLLSQMPPRHLGRMQGHAAHAHGMAQ